MQRAGSSPSSRFRGRCPIHLGDAPLLPKVRIGGGSVALGRCVLTLQDAYGSRGETPRTRAMRFGLCGESNSTAVRPLPPPNIRQVLALSPVGARRIQTVRLPMALAWPMLVPDLAVLAPDEPSYRSLDPGPEGGNHRRFKVDDGVVGDRDFHGSVAQSLCASKTVVGYGLHSAHGRFPDLIASSRLPYLTTFFAAIHGLTRVRS